MLQILTTLGIVQASEDSEVHDLRTDFKAPCHAFLAIHGCFGTMTAVPHILLINIKDIDIATELTRDALAGSEEFPDRNDIYDVPIMYGGLTDDRVRFYSI